MIEGKFIKGFERETPILDVSDDIILLDLIKKIKFGPMRKLTDSYHEATAKKEEYQDIIDYVLETYNLHFFSQPLLYRTRFVEDPKWLSEKWHVDIREDSVYGLFCYMTDVESELDGPFRYAHPPKWWDKCLLDENIRLRIEPKKYKDKLGPKDTMFFANIGMAHKAVLPRKRPRLMFAMRFRTDG